MEREEIKNKIIDYFRRQLTNISNPSRRPQIQMGFLQELFQKEIKDLQSWQQDDTLSTAREIVHEFMNIDALYPGQRGQVHGSDFYPWLTITEHGRELFTKEDWLPYDPDGYLKALKNKVPDIDDVTFVYIGESVAAFNRRQLLSATLTLGVASENLMLLLIEAFLIWIGEPRKSSLQKKILNKWIAVQYKEFKPEFAINVKSFPKTLQGDWETYLDGVFNFIRLNRNNAGHPTGIQMNAKIIYANLQIFADYARYILDLTKYFSSTRATQ